MGHFDWCAVFAAAYFDESSNDLPGPTIAVGCAYARIEGWAAFEAFWRDTIGPSGVDFHARNDSYVQQLLNWGLPHVMRDFRIGGICASIRRDDYLAVTDNAVRGGLGNVYCFAGFVCACLFADELRRLDLGDSGYFIEGGGPGSEPLRNLLDDALRVPAWKTTMRIAMTALVNRHEHLPVHPADLITHEVATNRATSAALVAIGKSLDIVDVSRDKLAEIAEWYRQIRRDFKHQRERERNRARIIITT